MIELRHTSSIPLSIECPLVHQRLIALDHWGELARISCSNPIELSVTFSGQYTNRHVDILTKSFATSNLTSREPLSRRILSVTIRLYRGSTVDVLFNMFVSTFARRSEPPMTLTRWFPESILQGRGAVPRESYVPCLSPPASHIK